MRIATLAVILIAAPSLARGDCTRDTTRSEPRTLFGRLGVAALHVDEGGSNAKLNGQNASLMEGRLAFAHCRWPSVTFAIVGGVTASPRQTTYVAPGSTNFRPELHLTYSGLEVTRRWRDSSIFHPMLALSAGTAATFYPYRHRLADGTWETRTDEVSRAAYVAPAAGVEAALFKHLTVFLQFGGRLVGEVTTPDAGDLSGAYAAFGFGVGKFR